MCYVRFGLLACCMPAGGGAGVQGVQNQSEVCFGALTKIRLSNDKKFESF